MPKIKNNFFYENLTFEKMLSAFFRAKENKSNKLEILKFEYNLEKNIIDLINQIKIGNYNIGKYKEFKVYEPKERIIKSLPFRDRIVHQWYVYEFIIPNIVSKFIYDSYACIKEKGTHKAVKRLSYFMNKARVEYGEYYVLKMDVKKFFYNISPDILFNIIKKKFKDKAFLELTSKLIFEKNVDKGIPIGNYTSQYFANIYLNELDQYIKHDLKIKYYLRFMDDFVLLVQSKEDATAIFKLIKLFLFNELNLELNHKSRYYPSSMGIDFCGYRTFHTHRLVRNRSKKRMKKRIKTWNKMHYLNKLDLKMVNQSFNSWKSHIKHADSYNLYNSYFKKIEFDLKNN